MLDPRGVHKTYISPIKVLLVRPVWKEESLEKDLLVFVLLNLGNYFLFPLEFVPSNPNFLTLFNIYKCTAQYS